jgi:hypothetical protein
MLRRALVLLLPVVLIACNTVSSVSPTVSVAPPTVEPTPIVPTEAPPPTAPAGPTVIPGWLTYHNGMIGYTFEYPPEGALTLTGVTGYPTDELPAAVEPGQYIATLEATYTEALCAGVELPAASFVLWSPQEKGGRYAGPCGVTGIGVYDIRKDDTPITVDGESLMLETTRLYEVGTETLAYEFSLLRLSDGTSMTLMSHWQENGLTYEDYLADRAILLQVMTSYRSEP